MPLYRVRLWNNLAESAIAQATVEASGYPTAVLQVLQRLGLSAIRYVQVQQYHDEVCLEYVDFVACPDGSFTAEAAYRSVVVWEEV